MEPNEIRRRFTYHTPDGPTAERHTTIRNMVMNLAHNLNDLLPEGREKSVVITHLEDACMWANKALAVSKSEGTQPQ